MKTTIYLAVVIAFLSVTTNQSVLAQEKAIANKHFYSELFGPGYIFSINFDSRFMSNSRLGLGYRIGAGFDIHDFGVGVKHKSEWGYYYYDKTVTKTVYTIPVGINYVFGRENFPANFEVGAGTTFYTRKVVIDHFDLYYTEKAGYFTGHLSFMFRIAPVRGGFAFRIGFTPIIGTSGDLYPMGAVGFGYAF